MRISRETRETLVNILRDHKDCLERQDYPMPCGRSVAEALKNAHLAELTPEDEAEIDTKAASLWELDGLIEAMEKGEDEA